MKHLTTLLIFILAGVCSFAQTDPKVKEILDKSAAKFKSYPAVEVNFELIMENHTENINEKHKGQAVMKGNMYKIDVMDVINYYDGKNIYTYMPEVKEVNIKNPSDEEEEMLNPVNLFNIHNKGFKQKYVSTTNGIAYIELTPLDVKKNYRKIGVWVNPSTSIIQKVTSFGKDGNNITVSINSMKPTNPIPTASFFKFDEKAHPGVEVIDLR